ncbi:MAG: DinB family protein [Bacteroidetes bacterium]|nr:DinB family protein [Bacteroidota bacterium]
MHKAILPPEVGMMSEYYESYRHYILENDIYKGLIAQGEMTYQFLKSLSDVQGSIRYEAGKWSIREVAGHIIDTERIFNFRALSIMRGDKQSLPGMEEDEYAANANYDSRTMADIADELYTVRQSTLHLIGNMDPEKLDLVGIANQNPVSVRALIYFMLVHERHHIGVMKRKYLGGK